jgi:thiamine biosynthesis lipoprotein
LIEHKQIHLDRTSEYWVGRFYAMASPCEVLMDVDSAELARELLDIAARETQRIEHKFSRYRDDNIVHRINQAQGRALTVDRETALLLDFAAACYHMSDGLLDITCGVLREVWRFDGSDRIPSQACIDELLPRIGWSKVNWRNPVVQMPADMQIDLGGIGKEYAADRVAKLLGEHSTNSCLINLGGDISLSHPRPKPWNIGIEHSGETQGTNSPPLIGLYQGALATSGDSHRFLLKDGIRYGHIINPKTGWPPQGAPATVTVHAGTCTEAGILSTLAILQGPEAERFLLTQRATYWCQWQ